MNKYNYIVLPLKHHAGYCPTICSTMQKATEQLNKLEKITGFKWVIFKKEVK